jgi:hypothetical protein
MAFNFLGTFSTGQYKLLKEFSLFQKRDIENRINYLTGEIRRTGVLTVTFDTETGLIDTISASGKKSILGKIFSAYTLLGGIPKNELPIRAFTDPVFLPPGTPSGLSTQFSNKRNIRNSFRNDAYVGMLIGNLKQWIINSIKFKREDLEFKIKKLVDWSDQCSMEILMLQIVGDITGNESLEKTIISSVPEATRAWITERTKLLVEDTQEDSSKKLIVLSSLDDMITFLDEEAYSQSHPSVTIDDSDIFGYSAGKIQESFDTNASIEDDITTVEK